MLMPMPRERGGGIEEFPRRNAVDPWRFVLIPPQEDSAYGLLDPHLADRPELPRDGLLSVSPSSSYVMPVASAAGVPTPIDGSGTERAGADLPEAPRGLMETFGFVTPDTSPPSQDTLRGLRNVLRTILGLGPARDDLVEDEHGNVHAPEVRELIQTIGTATKADEKALRRRIDELFRGDSRTAYWFHSHLSDLLAGDPPEDVLESLSSRADERFRDQRVSAGHLSSIVSVPVAVTRPGSRPFTHRNDPVPRDPNMEEFRRLKHNYELNQQARALERANVDPAIRKSVEGRQRNVQGEEFEGVARGYDTAYGRNVGPRLTVENSAGRERTYDHTLLDRLNQLLNPVEAKSGAGRIPSSQRRFDETMNPPVVYRKEKDVLADGERMLRRYDRLWMLRNPLPPPDRPRRR
ncbi:MAG: hypothetical protein BroJett029_00010 [Alphaproteobacteria bacterium]|nr:MAG: hypothetical protein BroJett029_00010 [Alphaproteobacteria bacterium]